MLSDKSMGENLIWAQCHHLSICPFLSHTSNISYATDETGCRDENQRMVMVHIICPTKPSLKNDNTHFSEQFDVVHLVKSYLVFEIGCKIKSI